MRAERQKIHLLKEGGADEEQLILARARYRGTSAEYTRFSKAMNLPQERDRVTVDGLGNIGQGKYKTDTPSEAKQEAPQATQENIEGNSSPEQNNTVQSSTESKENINNTSLDNSDNGGIIKETEDKREFEPLPPEKVVPVLRKDSEEWINNLSSEEVRSVKKYTKNSGDPDDDKFFARLNAMLRGDIPEDETLNYYSSVISGAISKFELQHDIVCYRAVEFNPVEGLKVGDVYKPKQFLSSSVSTAGALNGKYFLKIFAPKGSKGAYIELLSKYPKQREFLFDKDLNYNVLAVNGNIITVEAIV